MTLPLVCRNADGTVTVGFNDISSKLVLGVKSNTTVTTVTRVSGASLLFRVRSCCLDHIFRSSVASNRDDREQPGLATYRGALYFGAAALHTPPWHDRLSKLSWSVLLPFGSACAVNLLLAARVDTSMSDHAHLASHRHVAFMQSFGADAQAPPQPASSCRTGTAPGATRRPRCWTTACTSRLE